MREDQDVSFTDFNVLIVEDEHLVAMALAEDFEAAGAIVIGPAASIETALILLRDAARIDAAILDIQLQHELVYPLADVLMRHGVPFIFTSGHAAEVVPSEYAAILQCEKPALTRDVVRTLLRCLQASGRSL